MNERTKSDRAEWLRLLELSLEEAYDAGNSVTGFPFAGRAVRLYDALAKHFAGIDSADRAQGEGAPPAPLSERGEATYATPDDIALQQGPDDIPELLIAGAKVARFPKGSWAEVCDAFDGITRASTAAPLDVAALRGLVEKWTKRASAYGHAGYTGVFSEGRSGAQRECADELESILASNDSASA